MDNHLSAPPVPITIKVEAVKGICAFGYRVGHTWTTGQEGRTIAGLCGAAVLALGPVLQRIGKHPTTQQVSCQCPMLDRQVTFSVEPNTEATVSP